MIKVIKGRVEETLTPAQQFKQKQNDDNHRD